MTEASSKVFTIEKLVYGGDGLSRVDGEVILTPFVLPGETIEAEKLKARHQVQRARLIRVEQPSPDRTAAPCPVFGRCGGCQYQHAAYSAQLEIKRGILAETLRRVGKIDVAAESIGIESGPPYGYRNRVQVHIANGRVGYRAMGSNALLAIEECPIAAPKINEALAALNRMVRDRRWPKFLESIEVVTDDVQVQWNVVESTRPLAKQFFDWLAAEVPGTVAGALEYAVGEDVFRVSGNSFFQTNRFLIPRLVHAAAEEASGGSAWDLYAGVGLFSIPLSRRFDRVAAVEYGHGAAADLRYNAERAGVNVEVVSEQTEAFLRTQSVAADFVVADPPRAGLGKGVVTRLLELRPKALTIVSCDPATLARDLAGLAEGYSIVRMTMIDLFPQTFHIETVAQLALR